MTNQEKLAISSGTPVGNVFWSLYAYTEQAREHDVDFWLQGKGGYWMIAEDCSWVGMSEDFDHEHVVDHWPAEYVKLGQLDDDTSARLVALHAMNSEAFEQACKEIADAVCR
jgi:hypothetical protein